MTSRQAGESGFELFFAGLQPCHLSTHAVRIRPFAPQLVKSSLGLYVDDSLERPDVLCP